MVVDRLCSNNEIHWSTMIGLSGVVLSSVLTVGCLFAPLPFAQRRFVMTHITHIRVTLASGAGIMTVVFLYATVMYGKGGQESQRRVTLPPRDKSLSGVPSIPNQYIPESRVVNPISWRPKQDPKLLYPSKWRPPVPKNPIPQELAGFPVEFQGAEPALVQRYVLMQQWAEKNKEKAKALRDQSQIVELTPFEQYDDLLTQMEQWLQEKTTPCDIQHDIIKPGFFDYSVVSGDSLHTHVFTNFANQRLGGGIVEGSVQEELILQTNYGFFHLLSTYMKENERERPRTRRIALTKEPPPPNTECQNPAFHTPLLLLNTAFVLRIDKKIDGKQQEGMAAYGGEAKDMTKHENVVLDTPLEGIHLLSIAAPDLRHQNPIPSLEFETLKDLVNVLYLSWTQTKDFFQKEPPILIHTGRFGCGAFLNNPCLVYLIQRYMAWQLGVPIVYHTDHQPDEKTYEAYWQEVRQQLLNLSREDALIHILNVCKSK